MSIIMERLSPSLPAADGATECTQSWLNNKKTMPKHGQIKNYFSFPMETWRVHGKSLLPPTRIPVSHTLNVEADTSLPLARNSGSHGSDMAVASPLLPSASITCSVESNKEVGCPSTIPQLLCAVSGNKNLQKSRSTSSCELNCAIVGDNKNSTATSVTHNNVFYHEKQPSVSRKYQTASNFSSLNDEIGENRLTMATIPSPNIEHHVSSQSEKPPHDSPQPDVFESSSPQHFTSFQGEISNARMKLQKFLSGKKQQVKTKSSDSDKRKENGASHKKRRRIRYTSDNLKLLTYAFQHTNYPDYSLLKYIGYLLNLSPYSIKVWFQNERKKRKKMTKFGDLPLLNENKNDALQQPGQESIISSSKDLHHISKPPSVLATTLPFYPDHTLVSRQDPLRSSKIESSLAAYYETISNGKNGKNSAHTKKRKFASKTLPSTINAFQLNLPDLPQTIGKYDVTNENEIPMDCHLEETAFTLDSKQDPLVDQALSLDVKDRVIAIKDLELSSLTDCTSDSLKIGVKKDIYIKQENTEEPEDFPGLEDPKDSKESLACDVKEGDTSKLYESHLQVKEEFLLESTITESKSLLEVGTGFDTRPEPSSSTVEKKPDMLFNIMPKLIVGSLCGQLNENFDIKTECPESPVDHLEGIGQEVSESSQLDQAKEEELEVFDGLQDLKLPLFTIKYPGDVSNSSSDCVISVAVIQPNSYGAGLLTLPSTNSEKEPDKKRQPMHKSREYQCDMLVGVCIAKFKTWKHLEDHRKTHLSRGRSRTTYKCFYYSHKMEQACNVTVSKKSTLEKHMREHHDYND